MAFFFTNDCMQLEISHDLCTDREEWRDARQVITPPQFSSRPSPGSSCCWQHWGQQVSSCAARRRFTTAAAGPTARGRRRCQQQLLIARSKAIISTLIASSHETTLSLPEEKRGPPPLTGSWTRHLGCWWAKKAAGDDRLISRLTATKPESCLREIRGPEPLLLRSLAPMLWTFSTYWRLRWPPKTWAKLTATVEVIFPPLWINLFWGPMSNEEKMTSSQMCLIW